MSGEIKKKKLIDLARVIRSKNSGPFKLTFDIIFEEPDVYKYIKEKKLISPEVVARLYGFEVGHISDILYFDPAHAIKIVMPRLVPSGSPGDTDVYGAQQHAPLLNLEFSMD